MFYWAILYFTDSNAGGLVPNSFWYFTPIGKIKKGHYDKAFNSRNFLNWFNFILFLI